MNDVALAFSREHRPFQRYAREPKAGGEGGLQRHGYLRLRWTTLAEDNGCLTLQELEYPEYSMPLTSFLKTYLCRWSCGGIFKTP